ncbi:DUF6197 family protein [Streptomyces sp. NBC_01264]|uniref:DUF6197 family protein n=1 Tax=Streptomyces sp. NBC_01264 TaxID=2903804 RepID=UPI00224F190A|nr:hypothetical protein [Streptomyces sp. NBC_01264]MCX4778153.1 hypothetical protein [Streptomyces sp. NBC_01264]
MDAPAVEALVLDAPAAGPALTLDGRLALSQLAMDHRLDGASVQYVIRTAHIEIPEILVDPLPVTAPAVQPTTVADVLAAARHLISAYGWIRQYVGRAETGYCLIGAIRAAAGGNRRLEDSAEGLILDRIRAQVPDVLSVGQWNDNQHGPAPVLRILGG